MILEQKNNSKRSKDVFFRSNAVTSALVGVALDRGIDSCFALGVREQPCHEDG